MGPIVFLLFVFAKYQFSIIYHHEERKFVVHPSIVEKVTLGGSQPLSYIPQTVFVPKILGVSNKLHRVLKYLLIDHI